MGVSRPQLTRHCFVMGLVASVIFCCGWSCSEAPRLTSGRGGVRGDDVHLGAVPHIIVGRTSFRAGPSWRLSRYANGLMPFVWCCPLAHAAGQPGGACPLYRTLFPGAGGQDYCALRAPKACATAVTRRYAVHAMLPIPTSGAPVWLFMGGLLTESFRYSGFAFT